MKMRFAGSQQQEEPSPFMAGHGRPCRESPREYCTVRSMRLRTVASPFGSKRLLPKLGCVIVPGMGPKHNVLRAPLNQAISAVLAAFAGSSFMDCRFPCALSDEHRFACAQQRHATKTPACSWCTTGSNAPGAPKSAGGAPRSESQFLTRNSHIQVRARHLRHNIVQTTGQATQIRLW